MIYTRNLETAPNTIYLCCATADNIEVYLHAVFRKQWCGYKRPCSNGSRFGGVVRQFVIPRGAANSSRNVLTSLKTRPVLSRRREKECFRNDRSIFAVEARQTAFATSSYLRSPRFITEIYAPSITPYSSDRVPVTRHVLWG